MGEGGKGGGKWGKGVGKWGVPTPLSTPSVITDNFKTLCSDLRKA